MHNQKWFVIYYVVFTIVLISGAIAISLLGDNKCKAAGGVPIRGGCIAQSAMVKY